MSYNPGGQPPYNQQYPYNAAPPPPPPPKGGMGTGAKVALFGCLALVLLGIVAAVVIGIVTVAMSNKNGNTVTVSNANSSTSNANSTSSKNANPSASNASTKPSGATSGIHVDSIELARDEKGSAGEHVQSFTPTDNPMHAVVQLSEFESGTKVRVVLMAVSVATGEKNTKVAEIEQETGSLQNQLDTTFTLPRDWPTGTYRVDVYVNGNLDKSLTFQVES